jgi:hypothetical protein
MPFERQMANPQPTRVIPQSTARVPPCDERPESDHDSLERDIHDSNDDCDDDDDSPADNALRDEADSADSSNFRSCAWMFTGEWSSLYNTEAEFQEVYLPRIPFKVQHMRLYVNINVRKVGNACCTDVRGYLVGKLAPRFVWDGWLHHKLSWTPVKEIALNKDYEADDARANDVTSTWHLLITHGKYTQFRMLGKAFRFQLIVDVIVPRDFCDTILLDLVKDEFINVAGCSDDGFIQRKGINYLEVLCDLRPLTSVADEDVGNILNVGVEGYVQCKQSDLRKWQTWMDTAKWTLLRGGLCGNPDYAQSHEPNSHWMKIYTAGHIGRKTASLQAS